MCVCGVEEVQTCERRGEKVVFCRWRKQEKSGKQSLCNCALSQLEASRIKASQRRLRMLLFAHLKLLPSQCNDRIAQRGNSGTAHNHLTTTKKIKYRVQGNTIIRRLQQQNTSKDGK